jgi:hypothetical protein
MGTTGASEKPSVFINCPYDQEFEPKFLGMVFAITSQGFKPRSARESEAQSRPRFERIVRALADSRYSIHDLSRFTGEGVDNLARFNMPLELGIAIGLHWHHSTHNWLVLVPEGHQHPMFISDLAGFDLWPHAPTVQSVIVEVCAWLQMLPDFISGASGRKVVDSYTEFERRIQKLREDTMRTPIWRDIVEAASNTTPRP